LPQADATPRYRLCENYRQHNVCNWAVAAEDRHPLCVSCRLTRVVPDAGRAGFRDAWYRLEVAKRRLVHSLMRLRCPLTSRGDDPERGLAFDLLAETADAAPVFTGHLDGVITLSVAEADDAERERRRVQLHEPYRTLLGHFRHEIGHYYWERLVQGSPRIEAFRDLFGDERADYQDALQRHYEGGPPPDWQERFVSAYASAHPWEDWAETWAHYLHISDALDTAAACGLSLAPSRPDEPALRAEAIPCEGDAEASFERLIECWFPLTYVLNNLNRGLGLADAYPFVLSSTAIGKLRFVAETIRAGAVAAEPRPDPDAPGAAPAGSAAKPAAP
jgi:hypothetical protein